MSAARASYFAFFWFPRLPADAEARAIKQADSTNLPNRRPQAPAVFLPHRHPDPPKEAHMSTKAAPPSDSLVPERRQNQPDRRPAHQEHHAAAAARAPDPLLPDRRHAGRDADRRHPRTRSAASCAARTTACWSIIGPCSIHDPLAALEYARRLKAEREPLRRHARDRDARLLREAAHHGRLEGPDQRPLPRRELPHRRGPAHRAASCCSRSTGSGCRRAASSST